MKHINHIPQTRNSRESHNKTSPLENVQSVTRAAVIAVMMSVAGYAGYQALKSPESMTTSAESKNMRKRNPGEIMTNTTNSYAVAFSKLKKGEFIAIDPEGTIIDGVHKFPKNWDTLSAADKQIFRNDFRINIIKKHGNILHPDDIQILSMHHQLKGAEKDDTTFLKMVRENMTQTVINDPKKRTRAAYLTDNFSRVTGDATIDTFFKTHIVGLVAGESGFHNGLESNAGAIGMLQLMPWTISNQKVNPKKYTQEAVQKDFTKQVELAKNLMTEDYKVLKKYITPVANQYFSGNEDDAKKFLIAPLIFNAYNTGSPNIMKALGGFLKEYPNIAALEKWMQAHYNGKPGLDIFWAFTQFARESDHAKSYGSDSGGYVTKALAFTNALEKTPKIPQQYIPIPERPHTQTGSPFWKNWFNIKP